MNKVKSYLSELTVVAIGVLIALLLNNLKENYEAEEYNNASLETIKIEVKENLSELSKVLIRHISTLDTLRKYENEKLSLSSLFIKSGGLQSATLRNVSYEFYARNKISTIDYDVMSSVIRMKSLTELITFKLSQLSEFIYENTFEKSKESKLLTITFLENLIESETQLKYFYQDYLAIQKK